MNIDLFAASNHAHQADVVAARESLVEAMADVDEEVAELYLMEEEVGRTGACRR